MKIIDKVKGFLMPGKGITNMGDVMRGYDFMQFGGIDYPEITINFDKYEGLGEAYDRCSTVSTIINRNTSSLLNGKWWIVDKKENDVLKKYKGIEQLLSKPNPLQSWGEMLMQLDVYRQVFGETFLFAVKPEGYSIQDAVALWVLNPNHITIESSGKMYMQSNVDDIITRYIYKDGDENFVIPNDCILHIKDNFQNLNFSPSSLRGQSRLAGLDHNIINIMQAEEAVRALNKNRGAQGILSNDSSDTIGHVPLEPNEKEQIEAKLKQHYGMRLNQSPVIITDKNLKWQSMSFNVRDLMLFEGIESNIKRIAEAYNYPFELLSTENISYSNKKEAKADFYQGNIIPMAEMYAEKFSKFFGLENDKFLIDFSHVECLQKTEGEKADIEYKKNQAMRIAYDSGVISLAEWRLALGLDEEIYNPESNNNAINNERRNIEEEGGEQTDNV